MRIIPFTIEQTRKMTLDYLYCALWSTATYTESDYEGDFEEYEEYHLDERYTTDDFLKSAFYKAMEDCRDFLTIAYNLHLIDEYADLQQIAYDFWLTRVGHGTGFWDKPEIYGIENCKKLTMIADSFKSRDVIELENGKLDIM